MSVAAPPAITRFDEQMMRLALQQADLAAAHGDVPVGAVLVHGSGVVLARGRNRRELAQDPTAHAEIEVLRRAAELTGGWRQLGTTLYVTLEPCPMCAGALVNARVSRLVYGCTDPKGGAVDSLFQITTDPRLNHRLTHQGGVCARPCADRLRAFFRARRPPRAANPT